MGRIGYRHSEETKKKIGLANNVALKGNKCHLGKKHSEETKKKMSVAKKGKHISFMTEFKKGNKGFWLGKKRGKYSLDWREKISKGNQGKKCPYKVGRKPWNYRGITSQNKLERSKFREQIQKKVFERDNYKCVLCGEGGDLQVDHIQSWAEYVELRFNINNCRTLCMNCHYQITFGKPMPPTVRAWGHNFSRRAIL